MIYTTAHRKKKNGYLFPFFVCNLQNSKLSDLSSQEIVLLPSNRESIYVCLFFSDNSDFPLWVKFK